MIPGYSAVMQHAVAVVPAVLDASVANPLRLLLQNPDAQLVFLLVAQPGVAGAPIMLPYAVATQPVMALADADQEPPDPLLLSDVGWQSPNVGSQSNLALGDTTVPANRNFAPRLTNAYNYEARIPLPAGGGDKTAAVGVVVAQNNDGGLDNQMANLWGGRPVEIKIGTPGFDYSEFETLFKGRVADLTWDEARLNINLRPQRDGLARPLPVATYDGTGGLNGGAGLEGVPRPLCWGQVRNIAPILVDSTNRIFQVHAGQINAVQSVRDNGSALGFDADYADITTAAPAAGEYATSIATGYIRVGSQPAGQLTADVQGDATGGYVDTVSGIVQRILTTTMDYTDVLAGGFASLPAYTVGYYTGAQPQTAAQVFDVLLAAAGGWWLVDREGRVTVGVTGSPADPLFTFTAATIKTINRINTPQPVWSWRIGYQRMWTVQSADGLAAALSEADRDKYSTAYSYQAREGSNIPSLYPAAQELVANTVIDTAADAATEAERRFNRDKSQRHIYRLTTLRHTYQIKPGDSVRVEYPRFGLTAGRNFVVVGIVESSKNREAGLTLWG